ncbi:MAG: hypothetical protein MJ252_09630 [archaeon]|nr:hypothetical protein [archaeon]
MEDCDWDCGYFMLGNVSITLIYPLILSGICFISSTLKSDLYGQITVKDDIKYSFRDHLILIDTIPLLFYLLTGLFLDSKKLKKLQDDSENSQRIIQQFDLDSENGSHSAKRKILKAEIKKHLYWHLFLLAVFNKNYLLFSYLILYPEQNSPGDVYKLVEVYTIIAATRYFFDFPLNKHHYAGIVSMTLCFAAIQIILSFILKDVKYNLLDSLILSIGYMFQAFEFVYQKWIISAKFLTPRSFILIEGIFNFGVNVFFILIFSFLPCRGIGKIRQFKFCENHEYFIDYTSFFTALSEGFPGLPLKLFFYGIFAYIMEILNVLTLFNYNPIFRSIPDMLVFLFIFISYLLFDQIKGDTIFTAASAAVVLILYFMAFYSVFMILEVIIVKCCGLDENTKEAVIRRANKECMEIEELNQDLRNNNNDPDAISSKYEDDDSSYNF